MVDKVRLEEYIGLLNNEILGEQVTRAEVASVVNMGERTGIKQTSGEPEKNKGKARFFIKGGGDKCRYNTYAGVPSLYAMLTAFIYMLIIGAVIFSTDVEKAFQQIDDIYRYNKGALRVRIPAGLPKLPATNPFPEKYTDERWLWLRKRAAEVRPGSIQVLNKAHYGGKNASNLFVNRLQTDFQQVNDYTLVEEAVLVRREGTRRDGMKEGVPCERSPATDVIFHHVDDIQGAGEHVESDLEELGKKMKIGKVGVLREGGSDRFTGIDIQMERGRLYLSQMKYLQEVDTDHILEMAGGSRGAVDEHAMREVETEEIDPSIQDEVGAANGILGWGTKLLWKNCVFYYKLQRHIRNLCRRMLHNVGLVHEKVKKEKQRIKLRPLGEKGRKVHMYTDCRRKNQTTMVRKGVVAF
uniref:Reverse transcriptase Ty1/copia-type domain-containing protein n=1 Tax=Chromera velia CCMP2878 TaxID=1169474 RepID=A0A0G4HGC6_9ALVE|eukprot:Cvel_27347.t1-p1 / transcript=Cvel_27347.t1 / gene=Cvel_27347 / organism=Chromera_velia_CCMP2878 / gene_product=hypothetical protein / transcript_product=hypothetical protein / location=Cvel_scaffold3396:11061-12290(-) / protein_length=410 / sequence_SO=supercontig / SO=protein_coding / is_pseudo=false